MTIAVLFSSSILFLYMLFSPATITNNTKNRMNGKIYLVISFLFALPTNQQSLDIGIGVGIGIGGSGSGAPSSSPAPSDCLPPSPPGPECPPPPPPEPQPSDFPNEMLLKAYRVIQRFKKTITCDPKNVTGTWSGTDLCSYRGFLCETPPGLKDMPAVASVDFNGFGLCAPTISGFIDQLPQLAIFHANSNKFSGPVPDLTNLSFLYELDLSNNMFAGPFPSALLPLNQLIFLDIRYNSFSGSVPRNIFVLDLDVLFLNNNGFSQSLPPDLGISRVSYLTLANNGFTGPIPSSICNSSKNLIEVLFLNNQLSGCLPFEVGMLEEATVFDAGFNRITGPIPWSFGCLKKIEQLNLAGNLLYGNVPDVVCKLAQYGKLANLSLSGNYFTSVGYGCWELIKSRVLDVRKNCIVGLPDQRMPWECAAFFAKPKLCPFIGFIPCMPPYHWGGRNDNDVAIPSSPAMRRPGPWSGSVTYNAVHNRHG